MKRVPKKIKIILSGLLIIGVFGFIATDDNNFQIVKNLEIFNSVFRDINLYYVDETDPGDLIKTSIDKMLSSLDPYTVYIPESNVEDYKFMATGQYGGIGALIRSSDDYVIITEPYEGFPAHKAGLKAGDKIVKINNKEVKGKNSSDISELLKGDPNTEIKLIIKRPGEEKPLEKIVTRQKIKINSVPYAGLLTDNIGYIRLSSFTEDCGKEVKNAFQKLKRDNNITSLVFDLRGNPGGLLNEAVNISNMFIPKGQEVVKTKGKMEQWNKTYNATDDPIDTKIPIVVLVNSGSASASEIVSGVIQDLDRGVIIGTKTFGKGLVQTVRDLSYNSKMKITTAKYYVPSGRCIQALDYTHRNEDGSVGQVPDSLITEFKTKAGRKVYDGGGIMPDIKIEPQIMGQITLSLYAKSLIFDYATQFAIKTESIGNADNFQITDNIYNDFKEFLSDKDFDYKLESEEIINTLEKTVKREKYHSEVETELNQLRKKLAHDKNKDLQTFKSEISLLLREEIISRYYYQKGRSKASIQNDPAVDKAIEVLQDKEEYEKILTPKT